MVQRLRRIGGDDSGGLARRRGVLNGTGTMGADGGTGNLKLHGGTLGDRRFPVMLVERAVAPFNFRGPSRPCRGSGCA